MMRMLCSLQTGAKVLPQSIPGTCTHPSTTRRLLKKSSALVLLTRRANHLLSSRDGGRRYQLVDAVLLEAGDLLVCRRLPSCRLGEAHSLLKVFGTFSMFSSPNGFWRRRWRRERTLRRATHSQGGQHCPASLRWCRERVSASCAVYVARKVPPGWWCHSVFVGAEVHLPRALA